MVSSVELIAALFVSASVVFCLALILTLLARLSLLTSRLITFVRLTLPHCFP